jgi:hypothetical protein
MVGPIESAAMAKLDVLATESCRRLPGGPPEGSTSQARDLMRERRYLL